MRLVLNAALFCAILWLAVGVAGATELAIDGLLGFNGGNSAQVGFRVADEKRETPWLGRFAVGYTLGDAGDGYKAAEIFLGVTPTTNPNEEGRTWALRLDAGYRFKMERDHEVNVFGGLRYAAFTGKFESPLGRGNLEVTSNPFGLGVGIEGDYNLGTHTYLLLVAGIDFYFNATIEGEGKSFSPGDGPNEDGFSYDDVNKAINQPAIEPMLMMGVRYRFGG